MTDDMKAKIPTGRITRMNYEKGTLVPRTANAFRVRLAAMALIVAGILFVLYPALRPFSDEASLQGAAAFAATEWVVAHVLAMLGFILLTFGLLGLYISLQETTVERFAFRGLVLSWLGIGLTLPSTGRKFSAASRISARMQLGSIVPPWSAWQMKSD